MTRPTILDQVKPANDDQIKLMKRFWSEYGSPPHARVLNATLLKRDFLSILARLSDAEARIAELEATIKARENGLRVQVENHKHALRRIAELEKEKHAALTMIAMLEKQLAGKE